MNRIAASEASLERLLGAADGRHDVGDLSSFFAGVAAAPAQADPDGWMSLLTERPDGALRRALRSALAEARDRNRAHAQPGLRERLAAVRTELSRRGLDGFIVPRGDEHQGEYVALRSERLAWLTGFTGSAGWAIVLPHRAALFVDGRYTLQARAEVDAKSFAREHVGQTTPWHWLGRQLRAKMRVGFDPWLLTTSQVAHFRSACQRAGAELVAVDGNPIDVVWRDQPPPPLSPVVPHPHRYAGESSAAKRKRLAKQLRADGADAAVLAAPDSIAWLLNVRGGDVPYAPLPLGFAILHSDASVDLFLDPRKLTAAARRHLGRGVRVHAIDALGAALSALGGAGKRVRANPDACCAWIFDRLQGAGAKVQRGDDPCQLAKATKSAAELAGIRAAHRRDGVALTRFLAWLAREAPKGRLTEAVAAARLEEFRRANSLFRGPSFPTIAGAAANGAIVHYRVTPKSDRRLTRGSLFLIDSGGQYPDGTTDVTRTVAIGRPTREMRERFTRVLKGHIALASARFPEGTAGAQLDALARAPLWQAGLDYDHGTGHGVGHYLGVHEGPQRIAKGANAVPLRPGMVVSDEPGYYKTGAYGIRIENLVAVRRVLSPRGAERATLGFETLTLAPIDLALVDPGLLDAEETAWLDAYHARVRRVIGPRVDAETQRWLARATRPIRAGVRR